MMMGNTGKLYHHLHQDASSISPIHHNEMIKTEHSALNGKTTSGFFSVDFLVSDSNC